MKLWNDRVVIKNEEIVDFARDRDKRFLNAFEETMCQFIKNNVCCHCSKVLNSGRYKTKHELLMHTEEKDNARKENANRTCMYCQKEYSSRSYMKRHEVACKSR